MVGHRSRRDREEAGFGGAVSNQRHRRGGAGARVNGFDAHGVGYLLRVTVPAEVEFGWDAGGFKVSVSCHRSRPARPLSPGSGPVTPMGVALASERIWSLRPAADR